LKEAGMMNRCGPMPMNGIHIHGLNKSIKMVWRIVTRTGPT